MDTKRKSILGMVYSLIALICTLIGFYLIEHFLPESDSNLIQASGGDLKSSIELILFATGFFFIFRFMPSMIKRNAYFWGGLLVAISAIIIMMGTVPELKFINFTGLSLNPIEGCLIILIGVFFLFKGYMAYE